MKLTLRNHNNQLEQHLNQLKKSSIHEFEKGLLKEKKTAIVVESNISLAELAGHVLYSYQIFPENILIHVAEWKLEKREMQLGDTIAQKVFLPPIPFFSIKVIFGVRITEIIQEEQRIGFSYTTLEGHAEKGISTFTIEERDGIKQFVIHTFSEPGNALSRLAASWFTDPYQNYCTRRALKLVRVMMESFQ